MIPAMTELMATRDWLTVHHLASYAHELNPAERARSNLDQSVPSFGEAQRRRARRDRRL